MLRHTHTGSSGHQCLAVGGMWGEYLYKLDAKGSPYVTYSFWPCQCFRNVSKRNPLRVAWKSTFSVHLSLCVITKSPTVLRNRSVCKVLASWSWPEFNPKNPCKSALHMVHEWNLRPRKKDTVAPWGFLASQSSLLHHFVDNETPSLKEAWDILKDDTRGCPLTSTLMHIPMHLLTHKHIHHI